jgi:hypothetical protein
LPHFFLFSLYLSRRSLVSVVPLSYIYSLSFRLFLSSLTSLFYFSCSSSLFALPRKVSLGHTHSFSTADVPTTWVRGREGPRGTAQLPLPPVCSLLYTVCCLLSSVYSLPSAVCLLLYDVCCLLPGACCLTPTVFFFSPFLRPMYSDTGV